MDSKLLNLRLQAERRTVQPDHDLMLWAHDEIERLRAALAPFADCWDLWQGEKPPESRMLMFASEGGGTFLGYADVRDLRLAYEALHTDGQT